MKLLLKKCLVFSVLFVVLSVYSGRLFSLPLGGLVKCVTTTGAGLKDGTGWTNAYDGTQVQTAINGIGVAEVWIARGTYYPSQNGDLTISFQMKSGVKIYGGFVGTEVSLSQRNWAMNTTILSGDIGMAGDNTDNSYHVIFNTDVDNTATLDGFTIQGGNADIAGGGIFNTNSSPVISNCVITNNATNTGGNGAGMYNEALSSPTLNNCMILSNTTDGQGGGMYNLESSPTLINCDILKNTAGSGGGFYNDNSSSPVLNNSIIWANVASASGNQIYIADGAFTLNYSCYSNSTPSTGIADLTVASGSFSDINNNITSNPKFANFVNDYRLTLVSPCVDAGLDSYTTEATDIRGSDYGRKLNKSSVSTGTVDMGAYEFKLGSDPSIPAIPKLYVKADATGANDGTSWTNAYTSLQSALTASMGGFQIWVARGTYIPSAENDVTASFKLKSGLEVYGGFAGTETSLGSRNWYTNPTILSGYIGAPNDSTNRSNHVIYNSDVDNTAILDGFTIKGGSATDAGGGIYNTGNQGSSPTIKNCIITDNTTVSGGSGAGIYNEASSAPKFINCVISYNITDGNGGGIFNVSSSPTFTNCTVAQNKATLGGGIFNDQGSITNIYNSIFWGNYFFTSGVGDGRQIYINDGTVTLFNSCYRNLSLDISLSIPPTVDGTDITTDPSYFDPTVGDFRLGANSPCVDAGNDSFNSESTDIRSTDYSRKLSKTNAAVIGTIDMGAFEYKNGIDPSCGPIPKASVLADASICPGSSISIGGSAVSGSTYSWTSSPSGSSYTSSNPSVKPSVTTIYTLTEKNASGCQSSHSVTITVTQGATVNSASSVIWCNGVPNTYKITSPIPTATFTWKRDSVAGVSNKAVTNGTGATITETLVNTTNSAVNVIYRITPSAIGCTAPSIPKDVVVTIPVIQISSPATANWCSNTTNSYVATTNMTGTLITYKWTRAAVAGITNTAVTDGTGAIITEKLVNTTTEPILVHYLITPTVDGCLGKTKDVVVTVNPVAVIKSPVPIFWCSDNLSVFTPDLTTTTGTFTYKWTRTDVAGITSSDTVKNGAGPFLSETLFNTTTNPVVVHYQITPLVNGCPGTIKDVAVTVNQPNKPALSGPTLGCASSTGNVYTTPAIVGHTYSWSSLGGTIAAGSNTNSATVTWGEVTLGSVKVFDTTISSGCVNTNTLIVNLNPSPAAVAGADRLLCPNTSTQLGAAPVPGSTYSWSSTPAGFSSTVANPTVIATATTTYKLIELNSKGCFGTHNVVVAVPSPTITGPTTACESSSGNVYTTETGMSSYVWTVSSGGTITSGGTSTDRTVTIKWNVPGSQTVKVNYISSGGCLIASPTVMNVTVNPILTPALIGSASACIGVAGVTYTTDAGMTAYTWKVSSGGLIMSGTGTNVINVIWNTLGDQKVTVNYTNPNGCPTASETVKNITVNPLPDPTLSGPDTPCALLPGIVYSTETGMSGYSWSVSSGGTITSGGTATDPTITVTWNTAGLQSVSVNYRNANGCSATTAKVKNIAVNPVLVPLLSGVANVCSATKGAIYATQVGMDSYKWSVSNGGTITSGAGTSAITVDWNGTGTQQVGVNFVYPTGCSSPTPTVKQLTLYDLPVPTITGSAAVCVNTTGVTYTTEAGMTGYTWKISAGGTITSGGTATDRTVTVTWNTAGSQTVSVNYNNANGCSAISPTVKAVTVNVLPVPIITGAAAVCEKSIGNVYSTETGMTGYTWNVSAGGTLTSGAGTNQIAVAWNTPGAQTVSVNYVNTNGCTATAPISKNITVNLLIGTAGAVTGINALCGGTQAVYTIPAVTNASTYIWTLPAGATIVSGAGTSSITVSYSATASSGNISVYASNFCGNSNTSSLAVQVTPLTDVAGNISGPTAVCQGSTGLIFTVPKITNATSYTWSIPAGATIISGATTNSIVVNLSMSTVTGPITVYGSNSCGKGAVSPAFILTVNLIPPKATITPTGSNIASSAPTGNQWYFSSTSDGAGAAIQGATAQLYTPTQNGWYWTVVTINNCISDPSNHNYRLKAGENNRYNLFPVPNDGEFTVEITTPDQQTFSIQVYDPLGKKMYEHTDFVINGDFRQVINLRPLPTGIYTIAFRTKDGNVVRKFYVRK